MSLDSQFYQLNNFDGIEAPCLFNVNLFCSINKDYHTFLFKLPVAVTTAKIPILDVWPTTEYASKSILISLYYRQHYLFFLTLSPIKHLRGSFLRMWLADFSRQLFPREGSMIDSFLNAFFNSILMLLYYQYYYSLSFIYFVILSFPCFIILALIALSELFCVIIQHLF